METVFSQKTAKVVVVNPSSTHRFMILDAVRTCGFSGLDSFAVGKDLLAYLELETPDWVVMPLRLEDDKVNALQILKIALAHARFRGLRLSVILAEEDYDCLPLAFELGLLSWHPVTSVKDVAEAEFRSFIETFELEGWDTTLVAASYLRKHLISSRSYQPLLPLQQDLCQHYPGQARQLLNLAEAQFLNEAAEAAAVTLDQVSLLAPEMAADIEHLRQKHAGDEDLSEPLALDAPKPSVKGNRFNALGIANCIVIDPDSTMHYALTNLVKDFGVPHVQAFSGGGEAWEYLKANPEPGLIISEWRLPELTGPLLVQRIRSHQFVQVPIVVVSSLIQASEIPLVQEMGVSVVIEKPFSQSTVISSLAWVLQQHRHPTEQHSLERKMRQHLELGQISEAARLLETFVSDGRMSHAGKKAMEAEFAFATGQFPKALALAVEALKASGDNLMLFNLLGKCMLKTGQFDSALKCFNRAQKFSPGNIERLCRIADIAYELGDQSTKESALAQAAALDPGSPTVQTTIGNLALAAGDTAKAKDMMAQLESVGRLLALMNNRAISMTKSGQFEAAIELYRRTLEALPQKWSRNHDAVSYNLGLAFARYGELERCLEELAKVQDTSVPLQRKAESLGRRVKLALEKGLALDIHEVPSKSQPTSSEQNAAAAMPETSLWDLRKGDFCLYMMYRGLALVNAKALAMLDNPPVFVERQAIVRKENFTPIVDKAA